MVLGKPFKLLCHSDIGTLPIVYTLYSPNKMQEKRVLSKPGEEAIFNVSAVYKSSDINNFLCHAKNSQYRIAISETGHLLRLTNIIGVLDAAKVTARSKKKMLGWSNV